MFTRLAVSHSSFTSITINSNKARRMFTQDLENQIKKFSCDPVKIKCKFITWMYTLCTTYMKLWVWTGLNGRISDTAERRGYSWFFFSILTFNLPVAPRQAGRTAPIHIRPRSAPVKLDAPPLPDPPNTNWTYSPNTGFAPLSRTAPIHIRPNPHNRPRSAPVKLDAPPPSRSAPHKLDYTAPIRDSPHYRLDAPPPSRSAPHKFDLQPQYGIPRGTQNANVRKWQV